MNSGWRRRGFLGATGAVLSGLEVVGARTETSADASIGGRVYNEGFDYTIEGATVTVTRDDTGDVVGSDTSGEDGSYSVPVSSDRTYIVTTEKTGYRTESRTVIVSDPGGKTFNPGLEEKIGYVGGEVTNPNNGLIEGATVEFVDEATGETATTTTTDANGRYSVELLAEKTYRITADAVGYRPDSTSRQVEEGKTSSTVFVLAEARGFLAGTVSDRNSQAIEGATVEVVDEDTGRTVATETTDATGNFSVEVTAEKSYTVTADKDGYASADENEVPVSDGGTTTTDLELEKVFGSISGQVTDTNSVALEGVTVDVVDDATGTTVATATTSSSGSYTVDVLAERTYTVSADGRGYAEASSTVAVGVNQTATSNIVLQKLTGDIAGLVADANGDPIENANVEVVSKPTGSTVVTTTTDSSGNYSVGGLLAETTYRVEANKPGYASGFAEGTVRDGTTATVDVVLTGTAGTVSGTVEEADDGGSGLDVGPASLQGVEVTITRLETGDVEATTTTDANGEYEATVVGGNRYGLTARKDGYEEVSKQATVDVGATVTVDFELRPAERTVGDYAGDDEVVDTRDLQVAIQDWARGDIDVDLLQKAIRFWASGDPVSG